MERDFGIWGVLGRLLKGSIWESTERAFLSQILEATGWKGPCYQKDELVLAAVGFVTRGITDVHGALLLEGLANTGCSGLCY